MLCAYVMIPVRSRLAGEGHARIVLPRGVLLDVKHARRIVRTSLRLRRPSLRLLRTSLRIPNLFVLLDDDGGRLRDSCVALLNGAKQATKMITAPGVARTEICHRRILGSGSRSGSLQQSALQVPTSLV